MSCQLGFDYDDGYIYIGGINILKSTKYKNILKNKNVALVTGVAVPLLAVESVHCLVDMKNLLVKYHLTCRINWAQIG
jgi:hypothetical protein